MNEWMWSKWRILVNICNNKKYILVVLQAYSRLSGMTAQECIVEASELCSKKTTHQGIFFEVSVSLTCIHLEYVCVHIIILLMIVIS